MIQAFELSTETGAFLFQVFEYRGEICHQEILAGYSFPHSRHLTRNSQDIPLSSRIVSVTDAYDAMLPNRCYRTGLPLDEAIRRLLNNSGSHVDPELCALSFRSLSRRLPRSSRPPEPVHRRLCEPSSGFLRTQHKEQPRNHAGRAHATFLHRGLPL